VCASTQLLLTCLLTILLLLLLLPPPGLLMRSLVTLLEHPSEVSNAQQST
jgi:hypothetical protein